jgi:hypothetical protein
MRKPLRALLAFAVAISLLPTPAFCVPQTAGGMDLALVVDTSGSMQDNDPKGLAIDALNLFSDLCSPGTASIGAVAFSRTAKSTGMHPLRTNRDKEKLKEEFAALARIGYSGATDMGLALKEAVKMLDKGKTPGASRAIVLLSDGAIDLPASSARTNEDSLRDAKEAVRACEEDGTRIFALGLNGKTEEKYDAQLLADICEATGGRLYEVQGAEALPQAYRDVFAEAAGSAVVETNGEEIELDASISALSVVAFPPDAKLGISPSGSGGLYRNEGKSYSMAQLAAPLPGAYRVASSNGAKGYLIARANFSLHMAPAHDTYADTLSGYSIWLEDSDGEKIDDPNFLSANAIESISLVVGGDEIEFGPLSLPLNEGPDIDMSAYPDGATVQAKLKTRYLDNFYSNAVALRHSAAPTPAPSEAKAMAAVLAGGAAIAALAAVLCYRRQESRKFRFGTLQISFSQGDPDSIVWKLGSRSYGKKSVGVSEMLASLPSGAGGSPIPQEALSGIRFFRKGEAVVLRFPPSRFGVRGARSEGEGEALIARRGHAELFEKAGEDEGNPLRIRILYS